MSDIDPLIGRTFDDKYRVEERLGMGGMGAVYRAAHLRLEQPVALKVMNPHLLASHEARARFLREARTAGLVQHPNAVNVTDYGETQDGHVYLVMDFLEGSSLRQIITAEAPLDPARAVSLMAQISAAVAAAHDAGVIHRDLKPSNIFIEQRKDAPPTVRLLDFGIAKLLVDDAADLDAQQYRTGGGAIMGTPRYMSPEQSEGEVLTTASDVYSLGVMMYEMLTGVTPFVGNNLALIVKHNTEAPRPLREIVPGVPAPLEEVVLHALAKSPANRPAHAIEFRRELIDAGERLGLEHAQADLQPVLEQLKYEGWASNSGRFVIDIEKLREHRAAQNPAVPTADTPPSAAPVPPVNSRTAVTQELTPRATVVAEVSPAIVSPQSPLPDEAPVAAPSDGTRKGFVLGILVLTIAGVAWGLGTLLRPPANTNYEGVRQSIGAPPDRRSQTVTSNPDETPTNAGQPGRVLRGGTVANPTARPTPAPTALPGRAAPHNSTPHPTPLLTPTPLAANRSPASKEVPESKPRADVLPDKKAATRAATRPEIISGRPTLTVSLPHNAPPNPKAAGQTHPTSLPFAPKPVITPAATPAPALPTDAERSGAIRPRTVQNFPSKP